jgi:hypothetical protein
VGKTSYILMISDVFFLLDQPTELDFLKLLSHWNKSACIHWEQIVFIFSLLNAAWLAEMQHIPI